MKEIILPHNHGTSCAEHLKSEFAKADSFDTISRIFSCLGDTTRIRIFWLLCHCEECVINISALLNMSSPAVSHHLQKLSENNLIDSRRDGKEVYYRAVDNEEGKLLHQMVEKVMAIACPVKQSVPGMSYSPAEIAHNIHEYMTERIGERITIEELSRHFLINPTTLKESFKKVYGTSVASHMNKHRMEYASRMLIESDMSIGEIAASVGFESQSKFTSAFQKFYDMSPSEYRKSKCENQPQAK